MLVFSSLDAYHLMHHPFQPWVVDTTFILLADEISQINELVTMDRLIQEGVSAHIQVAQPLLEQLSF